MGAWARRANVACRKDRSLLRPPAAGWQGRQVEYANSKGPRPTVSSGSLLPLRAYSSCFFKALPLTHFLATPPALCSGATARADKAQMMEGGQEMCTALTTGMAKSLTTCASGDRECVLFIGKRGHQITVIIRNYASQTNSTA